MWSLPLPSKNDGRMTVTVYLVLSLFKLLFMFFLLSFILIFSLGSKRVHSSSRYSTVGGVAVLAAQAFTFFFHGRRSGFFFPFLLPSLLTWLPSEYRAFLIQRITRTMSSLLSLQMCFVWVVSRQAERFWVWTWLCPSPSRCRWRRPAPAFILPTEASCLAWQLALRNCIFQKHLGMVQGAHNIYTKILIGGMTWIVRRQKGLNQRKVLFVGRKHNGNRAGSYCSVKSYASFKNESRGQKGVFLPTAKGRVMRKQ